MTNRNEKLESALRETAAEYLAREAGRQSLITVTRVVLRDNTKSAMIMLTVMPESAEESAVDFANRHRREFAKFFEKRVRGARLPHLSFAIDRGEKNRQRLDELST
jgi:ribosome-binding factor A